MFTVDLHSHILPGMDDGAENEAVSLRLLQKEGELGIKHVVLSSHYNFNEEPVSSYVRRRNESFLKLRNALEAEGLSDAFDLRPAAEIRYSTSLADAEDLRDLCISGTNVLLIEFSKAHLPEFVSEVFYRLQLRGFVPLMAHVERFPWMRKEPDILYDLVCSGAYAQFNTDLMTQNREVLSFVRRMLRNGLLHCAGSDTHDPEERPPRFREAEKLLLADPGSDEIEYLNGVGLDLLSGTLPDVKTPVKPKKSILDIFRR